VPTPRVSVVVSSYRRPAGLTRLLHALAAQTLPRAEFEVIAVDNGAGPETVAVLAAAEVELAPRLDLRSVHHPETLGPAGGRNSGWRVAQAPQIAFTDDDCVPAPDWLEQLLAAAATRRADPAVPVIVQGRTDPDPVALARARTTLFTRIVSVQAADGRFETCNILYPRTLLERLGGFDERFLPAGLGARRPVGEDTDLGWRALGAGAVSVFAPAALVQHEVTQLSPAAKLAHQTRWGGAVHLFKVHPDARAILFRRYFWNVWHYMLLRALMALAAPAWLRRVIIGRYLRAMRLRARECGAGVWAVPYLILEDATEAAVLIAASLRERTPLL
jgi:GT2 family glycosyltransferase